MNTAVTCFVRGDPAAILDRHAIRRTIGVPTVSLLVAPTGAGGATWRRWAAGTGRSVVVAKQNLFPYAEWVRCVADQIDLSAAAIQCAAQRAGHDPNELLAAWRAKTPADCERFWDALPPSADDDLLRAVANLAVGGGSRSAVAAALTDLGERIVPLIARLASPANWPSILLIAYLDFEFGPRPAEVDLLCRSPRIAIELDGYFHFLAQDDYRGDRTKDWELQRRGFVVLRFLAEDVITQLETIRDRILDALTLNPIGGLP